MNLGSIFSGAANLLGAGKLLPTLGPAGFLASMLLDPLKDMLGKGLASHMPALPQQATDAILARLSSGFLSGLKG